MKKYFVLLLLISCFKFGFSQYFQTGQDPASIKWSQINTPNFQIIYPKEFENKAQHMAHMLEKIYQYGGQTLKFKPKKISVILHTRTVKSNGLVALAPRRMELYTTPHQSIYPQDWLEQLVIHEFRHVVQVDKINDSMPGIIHLLLGQQGSALITGLFMPFWLLEGDAVITETALSNFGRGRLPSFLMEHKAQISEQGVYSLNKAYHGSYNDFVPNHYKLGYYLAGEIRSKYGSPVWEKYTKNVGKNPFSLIPGGQALKKETSFTINKLYHQVFDSLKTNWNNSAFNYDSARVKIITKPSKIVTNYNYNFFNNGEIISLKSAFNSIPQFVSINSDGNERKIYTPGSIFNESAGFTSNLLIWSEQIPDPRWSHSGKSVINILNIENKQLKKFHSEYKCFSPSISPDKQNVAVVETDFLNNYYLSVYSITTGKKIAGFQTAENNYFFTPKWIDNNNLVAVILTDEGKLLATINPFEEKNHLITETSMGEVKHPVVVGNRIYFISGYSGKNDLYVLNQEDNSVFRIFESRFGVEYPAISDDEKTIYLSDYTSTGFRTIKINNKPDLWIPFNKVIKGEFPLAEKLAAQEPEIQKITTSDTAQYESRKYNKLGHLFHFHSWNPMYFNVNSYDIKPGISFLSQNKLGTTQTTFGYKWDLSEKTGSFFTNFTYSGWYPIFNLEFNYGKRGSDYMLVQNYVNENNEITRSDTISKHYTYNETTLDLNIHIPFNLSSGKFSRLIRPEIAYGLKSISHTPSTPEDFYKGNLQSLTYRLYFHQLLRQSPQDLLPDFGIAADILYRHSPINKTDLGSLTSLQIINYLPGVLPNHGIRIYNGFQTKEFGEYQIFSDGIRYPRGWSKIQTDEMYSFSASYVLPLLYPDLSLGALTYIKRLKASLFYDYAYQKGNIYQHHEIVGRFARNIATIGAEITSDLNFLRFYAPVEMGFRAGYMPEAKTMHYGFLFSIDFTSF